MMMNAALPATVTTATKTAHLMTSTDYRESLRRYKPIVYVDGQFIESVGMRGACRWASVHLA